MWWLTYSLGIWYHMLRPGVGGCMRLLGSGLLVHFLVSCILCKPELASNEVLVTTLTYQESRGEGVKEGYVKSGFQEYLMYYIRNVAYMVRRSATLGIQNLAYNCVPLCYSTAKITMLLFYETLTYHALCSTSLCVLS